MHELLETSCLPFSQVVCVTYTVDDKRFIRLHFIIHRTYPWSGQVTCFSTAMKFYRTHGHIYLIWWKSYLFFRKDGSLSLVQRSPPYRDQTEEDVSSVLFQLRFCICCQKSTWNGLTPHLQYVNKPFNHESSSSGISEKYSLKGKHILSPMSYPEPAHFLGLWKGRVLIVRK